MDRINTPADKPAGTLQAGNGTRFSEDELRTLFETSEAGIGFIDPAGRVSIANTRMAEMFARRREDFLGDSYLDYVHPAHRAESATALQRLMDGQDDCLSTERRFIRADGTDFWGHVSGRRLLKSDGALKGLVWIIADISDRKRAEEDRLQLEAQVQHAQKLESLGVLAGGMAHDFNNLLTAILGNAGLALMDLPPDSPAVQSIRHVETAAMQAAGLANQMLAYSGKGRFVLTRVNLSHVVDEIAGFLRAGLPKKVALQHRLGNGKPILKADAEQIRQVIVNLITNAAEAIGDHGGVVTVSTGVVDVDRDCLASSYIDDNLRPGHYAFIEVSDTGCGMTDEAKSRMFEPFFTTKFTGRGLGLAAVLGIVRGHRGAITVDSELNRGTTVRVLFPLLTQSPESVLSGGDNLSSWQGSGAVLIVDDEESVRLVAEEMLRRIGFRTLRAASGTEGLKLFRQHADEIDMVLLDLTMPDMDGHEVFEKLREMRHDVKVVLSSGYSEQEAIHRFAGMKLAGFIQKPYQLQMLRDKVRDVFRR